MSNRLKKLMFRVSLIDKLSGPASKIINKIEEITKRAQKGMQKIATGAAGLFSTGFALQSLLSPAIAMDRALGEVRSLGVREKALQLLEKASLKTSVALGENAAEMVRSAYDIQSAIGGLSDRELSEFTVASAILAKGTKSDAATITDYMGTMYGIFEESATAMGKSEWVERLTGQTATAVQMFKTTGAEMASGFSALGSQAQVAGIEASEQMAVLGTLQATMSGSEAATKYGQFIANVGKAQQKLNLDFTDSQGRMLGVVEILNKLKNKFGDTLEVSEQVQLRKAFGSQQAVQFITGLIGKTESLNTSIDKLSNVKGMNQAEKMAKAIADPWERGAAAGVALKTVFGRVMQPVLVPLIELFIKGLGVVQGWTEKYPMLTKVIGIATLVTFGLVAAVSALAIIGGVAQLAVAGFSTVLIAARTATLLFSAALWANPITWVIAGIVALVVAIGFAIKHWDTIKKTIMDFAPFKKLRAHLGWIIDQLNKIPGINIGGSVSTTNTIASSVNGEGVSSGESNSIRVGARDGGLLRQSNVPQGGLEQSITNNGGNHIEKLEVKTTGSINGFRLADELELAGA